MARCLVTGHKGYIGSKLFAELQELGHDVMGIDLNDNTSKDILKLLIEGHDGSFHPHYWNFKPEYVFHLACWPRVGYSIENPVITMKNNVLAGSLVLNFARKVGAKRFIYSSSSSIVGNGKGPTSPYALQKMVTEVESKLYSELYGLDTVSLRYFNVYSEDQPADGPYATAVCNWMQYIRDGKKPFITGNGDQSRDMLHVDDAVSANIFAMKHEEDFNGKHFDVGTGKNISLNRIKEVVEILFPKVKFEYKESRPNEVLSTRAATRPLEELGWETKMSIKNGVFKCFKRLQDETKK
mgnify:CR=1 FL=1|tara:strand:+ start:2069 stop:2956 length:888 start_codon:yes stop_codon:yes gene_type:complete